jgi:hypothetical protein
MTKNRISLSITDEQKEKIEQKIAELAELLRPHVIALDKADRKGLSKMSDKSIPFAQKIKQYVDTNPEFVPQFVDINEYKTDFQTFLYFRGFLRPMLQMISGIEDTSILSGAYTYKNARAYYESVGQAAKMNVQNAEAIYEDLRERFEQGKKKTEPEKPK